MSPEDITIAITFYSHKKYVRQAVASALNQTVPVRVMVVENCSTDPDHGAEVKGEFGSRIKYIRNPAPRGPIGNWNSCLENCETEWISILHDDDFLAPNFVEEILKLAAKAPGRDLYFGQTIIVNKAGEPLPLKAFRPVPGPWVKVELIDLVYGSLFSFPGQLFRVSSARSVGGFRVSSYYCPEWEMWAKLIARSGAAQTGEYLGYFREHGDGERLSNRAYRRGVHIPATVLQHKRVLALLRPTLSVRFDRVSYQRRSPAAVRFLLECGYGLSARMLAYHLRLLRQSPSPHWRYAAFKGLAAAGGAPTVRLLSKIWNWMHPCGNGRP